MQRSKAILALKARYVAGAHLASRVLRRAGIGSGALPRRDQRFTHWLYSLTRVHDSLELARLDVPWWTYRAIDAVENWLTIQDRPVRAFEYGSGASTIWLAKRVYEVHSVEHHRGFAEALGPSLTAAGNVTLHIVEPAKSDHPAVPSRKEGSEGLDFADYVAAINAVPGNFDLIVIDGRAREACLDAAKVRLSPEGLIVFDNSLRRRYRPAIDGSGLEEWVLRGLVPTLPYPEQTSLLTKAVLPRSLLDVRRSASKAGDRVRSRIRRSDHAQAGDSTSNPRAVAASAMRWS